MRYAVGLLLFVVGSFIGLRLADFDLIFHWWPLIVHRSLLTHGFLIPLLLMVALRAQLAGKNADPRPRLFLLGFCLASAVHLCFDLFPRAWRGYALVHVPLLGWMSPVLSGLWLVIGALVCLYLGCRLLHGMRDLGLSLLGLVTSYGVCTAHDPFRSFFALVTLVPLALIAFVLPRRHPDPDNPADEISRWLRS